MIPTRSGPDRSPHSRLQSFFAAHGFVRFACGFLALVVLLQGCLMGLFMSLGLVGILFGLYKSEGPMMVVVMSIYLVLSVAAVNLSWSFLLWLTMVPNRSSVPPHLGKSPMKSPPDLWDRDLDEAF
jgi:hypothetical protein